MSERLKVTPVALVALVDDEDKILLQRRANTQYKNGWWDLPSGHIELGETPVEAAARETLEETGVIVEPEDLELFNIYTNEDNPGFPYLGFIFRTSEWSGEPTIQIDDDKCDAMGFYSMDNLPDPLTAQVTEALRNIGGSAITYSYFAPNTVGS